MNVDLDHFRARILQDCLTEATAAYWLRRSVAFEEAAPRPVDFHGSATQEELRERWKECMATARACRRHAQLIMDSRPEEISREVWDALGEVA
jgi:hypothetical protein